MSELVTAAALDKLAKSLGNLQQVKGAQGPKGDQGTQGPKGPKGDAGPQGPVGDSGATGTQGPRGDKGPQGKRGPEGPTGPQGPRGEQGVSVVDVTTDIDGELVFVLSDGQEITVDIQGLVSQAESNITYVSSGGGSGSGDSSVTYTEVTETLYQIEESQVSKGKNIFGINAGADAIVRLPETLTDPTKLITISNEMASNTVTIEYLP